MDMEEFLVREGISGHLGKGGVEMKGGEEGVQPPGERVDLSGKEAWPYLREV